MIALIVRTISVSCAWSGMSQKITSLADFSPVIKLGDASESLVEKTALVMCRECGFISSQREKRVAKSVSVEKGRACEGEDGGFGGGGGGRLNRARSSLLLDPPLMLSYFLGGERERDWERWPRRGDRDRESNGGSSDVCAD